MKDDKSGEFKNGIADILLGLFGTRLPLKSSADIFGIISSRDS